ncbi:TPA: RidA family protein [Klebsiella pneumoniae]|uniref:RidA family protein n=1 Tax=Klebsiella pneumoniae complex TaxID=3390273 RepID=UPI000A26EC7A|nr:MULTISPECIES: RidA family protein [Klebsiella]HBW2224640.1 RidA family protein [Klebsiella quasipneumoniae subsp. quasipneumoniae]EIX9755199.1 RidA family protein [Klebsiella pneumoniae]MBV0664245.1 RidA family protein [Klebsiella pneumoniae]MCP5836819.1 RidA family protein [Klebsiella pneumoniae]MDE4688885.1 RidA family protein [Klebsiella pneumoniae]
MKKIIKSDCLAEPVGPFSAGISFERLIFTSGQVGQLPESGQLAGDDLESQARQALKNLLAVIEAGGGNRNTVLKVNCWLRTMNDFAAFNAIYKEFFGNESFPARTCIAVAELPLVAKVEVEAIAYRQD